MPNKSRHKPKHTDCFNDPAFIELFRRLRLDAEGFNSNQPNSTPNSRPSSQAGLATPPETFIDSPDIIDSSSSTMVGEGNIVVHDSTIQASCDNMTVQASAPNPTPPVENMTPTSRASHRKKFYVVTRGRRTGVFDNWSIVQPLVNRIPGNCHISFESYEVALEVYEAAKRRDDLRVIWITIEDELTYGPEKKDAMM